MSTMGFTVDRLMTVAGPEPAILDWYGHPTDLRERSSPARGVWGHAPPGKFGNIDALRSFLVRSKSVLAVSLSYV